MTLPALEIIGDGVPPVPRLSGPRLSEQRMSGRRLFWGVSSLMSALVLGACAPNPANADTASPSGVSAEVSHACTDAMGLNPSEAEYGMCARRLQRTVAGLERERLVAEDRAACAARGLQPGTPDFAVCVVAQNQPSRY